MRKFALVMIIALLLAALSGKFGIVTVIVFFCLFWYAPAAWRMMRDNKITCNSLFRLAHFLWDFLIDLTKSNLKLAWDVLTPTDYHRVTLIEVPIGDLNDFETALLSHRITLTPGTLSCILRDDRKALLVHAMYPEGEHPARALRRPLDILKGQAK